MSDKYLGLTSAHRDINILRALGLEKLKIRWGIKTMRFEKKIREKDKKDFNEKMLD